MRHGLRLFGGSSAARDVILFSPSELREQLKADCTVPAGNTTVLASRALLEQAGGFDTQLSTCDDWDLWLRFAALSVLVYVDVPLAAYRIWLGQSSSNERAFMRDAATVRARYFPEASPYLASTWLGGNAKPPAAMLLLDGAWKRHRATCEPPGWDMPPAN